MRRTGEVACWGSSRLGDGPHTVSDVPVAVVGLTDAVAVEGGSSQYADDDDGPGGTCVLRRTGEVSCWGSVAWFPGDAPTEISGRADATGIAVGRSFACAARATGRLVCWGLNDHGKLGNGKSNLRTTPVTAAGLAGVSGISRGSGHVCTVDTAGGVACWGGNGFGVLMQPEFLWASATPLAVSGLSDVTAV